MLEKLNSAETSQLLSEIFTKEMALTIIAISIVWLTFLYAVKFMLFLIRLPRLSEDPTPVFIYEDSDPDTWVAPSQDFRMHLAQSRKARETWIFVGRWKTLAASTRRLCTATGSVRCISPLRHRFPWWLGGLKGREF